MSAAPTGLETKAQTLPLNVQGVEKKPEVQQVPGKDIPSKACCTCTKNVAIVAAVVLAALSAVFLASGVAAFFGVTLAVKALAIAGASLVGGTKIAATIVTALGVLFGGSAAALFLSTRKKAETVNENEGSEADSDAAAASSIDKSENKETDRVEV